MPIRSVFRLLAPEEVSRFWTGTDEDWERMAKLLNPEHPDMLPIDIGWPCEDGSIIHYEFLFRRDGRFYHVTRTGGEETT